MQSLAGIWMLQEHVLGFGLNARGEFAQDLDGHIDGVQLIRAQPLPGRVRIAQGGPGLLSS